MTRKLTPSVLACALVLSACGKVKDKDESILVVEEPAPTASAGSSEEALAGEPASSGQNDPSYDELKELYDLYAGNDGLTKEELENLLKHYGGENPPSAEDIFKGDHDGNGKLTPGEGLEESGDTFAYIRWIPKDGAVKPADLNSALAKDYPDASAIAVKGLVQALFRFDETSAGGNKDGLLTRSEIGWIGTILGSLEDLDFTNGLKALWPDYDADPLQKMEIERRLNRQIYARQASPDFRQLSTADFKLEVMIFATRFESIKKWHTLYGKDVTDHGLGRRVIDEKDMPNALAAYRFSHVQDRPAQLRNLLYYYDGNLADGSSDPRWNHDGKFDLLESVLMIMDIEYFQTFVVTLKEGYASNSGRHREHFFGHLMLTFPNVGWDLFLEGTGSGAARTHLRDDYWGELVSVFDELPEAGGNKNGAVDWEEIAVAFNFARLVDLFYFKYDLDKDGSIEKPSAPGQVNEAVLMIHDLRPEWSESDCAEAADVLFGLKGTLDPNDKNFDVLKYLLSGKSNVEAMKPWEFQQRVRSLGFKLMLPERT